MSAARKAPGRIFIIYRREDAGGVPGPLRPLTHHHAMAVSGQRDGADEPVALQGPLNGQ